MTLAEAYKKQNIVEKKENNFNKKEVNLVVHMPEVASLIKHLDLIYSKLINDQSRESEQQPMVEILGKPYIQTRAWYNPGQGIKQSEVVK